MIRFSIDVMTDETGIRLLGGVGSSSREKDLALARLVERKGIVSHVSFIADDEREVRDGIPVTSPFRTIFDLAAVASRREVERAWHEAEVRQLTDRVSLPVLLERYPGRRGTKTLRELLGSDKPLGISRNEFEEA